MKKKKNDQQKHERIAQNIIFAAKTIMTQKERNIYTKYLGFNFFFIDSNTFTYLGNTIQL